MAGNSIYGMIPLEATYMYKSDENFEVFEVFEAPLEMVNFEEHKNKFNWSRPKRAKNQKLFFDETSWKTVQSELSFRPE